MAVEDHPLFPKWKTRLEELFAAKKLLAEAQGGGRGDVQAATARYNAALFAYNKISEEI